MNVKYESAYWKAIQEKIREEKNLAGESRGYAAWADQSRKDGQITFRIARADYFKLQRMAKLRRMKYQTLLRGILREAISRDEESLRDRGGRAGAGAPR